MQKVGNVLIEVIQDLSEVSTDGKAEIKVNTEICSPQRFKQLFNYFSQGTILERVDLDVKPLQTQMKCSCGHSEPVQDPDNKGYKRCPSCGRYADIDQKPYELVHPDPQKATPRQSIRF